MGEGAHEELEAAHADELEPVALVVVHHVPQRACPGPARIACLVSYIAAILYIILVQVRIACIVLYIVAMLCTMLVYHCHGCPLCPQCACPGRARSGILTMLCRAVIYHVVINVIMIARIVA